MEIEVTRKDNRVVVFVGDADEYLEKSLYNANLEEALNQLDNLNVGSIINFEKHNREYQIEKIDYSMFD